MAVTDKSSVATTDPSPARLDTRRNIAAYIGDSVSFFSGMAFIPATTVLVGLASTLISFTLPQPAKLEAI
jgi:hypothetical protein